jgi:translation initiation factor eIF-2B subunit beta
MDCNQLESLDSIVKLKKKIKNKNYPNSTAIAIETSELFKLVIAGLFKQNKISSFPELIRIIRTLGNRLIAIDPLQFSIGNIIKRILHIVREEYKKCPNIELENKQDKETNKKRLMSMTSLNGLIDFATGKTGLVSKGTSNLRVSYSTSSIDDEDVNNFNTTNDEGSFYMNEEFKTHISAVLTNINELQDELEFISDLIVDQAHEHINDNDVILTANHSEQLEEFFIEAAKQKTFHVIVAESAPTLK